MTAPAATRLICPLTAGDIRRMRADAEAAAAAGADTVEFRLDYLAAPPKPAQIKKLLAGLAAQAIVTNRPAAQGGRFAGDERQRLKLLAQAAACGPAFVDVELGTPQADWPAGQIILSFHDFDGCPDDLDRVAARIEASPAAVNKVVFTARGPEDALRALDLLRQCRKPTMALAMGEAGVLSRILAKKFSAFGTFASLAAGAESAPGQPTVAEVKGLYRWDRIGPETAVYGVIGCPVGHSMSPAIHNAAFSAAGIDAVYVPVLIQPGADNFHRFLDAVQDRPWLNWRGLSVTIPHKENALAYVGHSNCDELARKIGAVNTITIGPRGALRGDNTDYAAAIDALCGEMGIHRAELAGRSVAVLGAGGAARSIVAALAHYGARIAVYNRTADRGRKLADEFGARAAGLDLVANLDAEIVINCTPLGMSPKVDASPLPQIPPSVKVVFDTIYNPAETLLLQQARQAGCLCVSGLDMFVNQAVAQFEIWTGRKAPASVMRDVVVERLRTPPR